MLVQVRHAGVLAGEGREGVAGVYLAVHLLPLAVDVVEVFCLRLKGALSGVVSFHPITEAGAGRPAMEAVSAPLVGALAVEEASQATWVYSDMGIG